MNQQQLRLLVVVSAAFLLVIVFFVWKQMSEYRGTIAPGSGVALLTETNTIPRLPPSRSSDPSRDYVEGTGKRVTITKFADFSCLYCRLLEQELRQAIQDARVPVRLVWRDLPLSDAADGLAAANIGRCAAEQGKFWEIHDLLMEGRSFDMMALPALASTAGVEEKKFFSCVENGKYRARIEADAAIAKENSIHLAPTLFVGREFFQGYVTAEEIKAALIRASHQP